MGSTGVSLKEWLIGRGDGKKEMSARSIEKRGRIIRRFWHTCLIRRYIFVALFGRISHAIALWSVEAILQVARKGQSKWIESTWKRRVTGHILRIPHGHGHIFHSFCPPILYIVLLISLHPCLYYSLKFYLYVQIYQIAFSS